MNKISLISLILIVLISSLSAQVSAPDLETKIQDILSQLTLEEKVAMVHAQSKFSSPGVPRLGIPEIWMSDGPHGVRPEIKWDDWSHAGWTNDSTTAFPALTALAASFNPTLAGEYGKALGEEARYRKKEILLGPGVNIYRTPLNGRNFEYMGEDPFLAATLVVPYIKGVQQNGVSACLKHYALNNQEKWRGHINVEVSDRALHEIYLPPHKAAVTKGGVWTVMGAYNKFRGQHTTHHEFLVNKILKGDWGFDGVFISDWGSAHDTRESALYGLDIEMGTGTDGLTISTNNAFDYYYLARPFLAMLRAGEIKESVLDDKVTRILRLMHRTSLNPDRPLGSLNTAEHLDVARRVGAEGVVLLKNQRSFLPLNPKKEMTIAVIGENAVKSLTVGGGSSELKARDEVSPLRGIQERFPNAHVIHTLGYASGPPQYGEVIPSRENADSLKQAAVEVAKQADVVLYFGGLNKNWRQDCEGDDRKSMALPFGQDQLINKLARANKNIAVILISGNAVEMPWLSKVKSLVQAWYLGSEAGHALADIISGDVNPSGKLPFTFPVKLTDNAAHYHGEFSYPGDGETQEYKEDILVGYRWHDTKQIEPRFAFGFGLSYTKFKLSKIKTDKKSYSAGEIITISCELANKGRRAGSEVVQVYVGKSASQVDRALKELKAFQKVHVKPGDKVAVNLTLNTDDLAFYDETISDWNLESGEYQVYVGTASDDIDKTLQVTVK